MNDVILKRIGALMSVKSLVTLVLTGVFAYMACAGKIGQDFMTDRKSTRLNSSHWS